MTHPNPIDAQVQSLEDTLALHARIKKLTQTVATLEVEHGPELDWSPHGWLPLTLGFGTLGLCIGYISGLSVQKGITGVLLTGVMTFVGGTLLSHTGFRWKRGTDATRMDPLRVGLALVAFSLCIILGVRWGIGNRDNQTLVDPPVVTDSPGSTVSAAPVTDPGRGGMRSGDCPQSDPQSLAASLRSKVNSQPRTVYGSCAVLKKSAELFAVCAQAEAKLGFEGHETLTRALMDVAVGLDPTNAWIKRARATVKTP